MATLYTLPRRDLDPLGEGVQRGSDYDYSAAGVKRRAFRPDIQGMRAVAVTLVVVYHCGVSVVSGGYVGVDVFLVISGFLITLHLVTEVERTGTVSITGFYARRIRRLLPPALVVVVATVIVARVWGPLLQSTRTAWDGLFAAFYGMNYRLAEQGVDYQQANAAPSPLQHFWSLAVEEQFYVFWPLMMLAFALVTRGARSVVRRSLLTLALVAVIVVSLRESLDLTQTNGPLAYFSLQSRAWELGVGALIAVTLPLLAMMPKLLAGAITWIGLAMILVAAVTFDDSTPFPGSLAAIPVAGAALVIAGGVVASPWGVVRILRGRLSQFIGHVSYGWYLWHWPVIILGPAIFGKQLSTLENLELCVLALWLATLTFLLVERPTFGLHVNFRRWFGVALAMSGIVAVTSLGAVAFAPNIQGDGASVATADVRTVAALKKSIDTALSTDDVPSNLRPSLARADADVPQTSIDGCHVPLLKTTQRACVYGDPDASRTMLLFGDSHAEQWFGALNAMARSEGWRLVSWTKVACPLADVSIRNEQLKRTYSECNQWRDARLTAIRTLRPDLIVASQADSLVPYNFSNKKWADGTSRTLRRLSRMTPDLVLLSDTPRATNDVPTCLTAHLTDRSACDVASDAGLRSHSREYGHLPARHRAVQRAALAAELTMIDTQNWFCRAKDCPAVVGNSLVYRDDSHMTQVYSRSLAPLLEEAIDSTSKRL